MTLSDLKKIEGAQVMFPYRGKLRPFIMIAVQQSKDAIIKEDRRFLANIGDVRLEYDWPSKTHRNWSGFWTNKLHLVELKQEAGL